MLRSLFSLLFLLPVVLPSARAEPATGPLTMTSVVFSTDTIDPEEIRTFERGAFQVWLPLSPFYKRFETEAEVGVMETDTFIIHSYFCLYLPDQLSYLARFHDYPSGWQVEDGREVLDEVITEFTSLFGPPVRPVRRMEQADCPAREVVYAYDGHEIWLRAVLRGARVYILMVEDWKPAMERADSTHLRFFESFGLLPLQHGELTVAAEFPEYECRVGLPDRWESFSDELTNDYYPELRRSGSYAMDTLSGITYTVNHYAYSPYQREADTLAYYQTLNEALLEDTTLLWGRDTFLRGIPAWYGVYSGPLTATRAHHLIFFSGPNFYELVAYVPGAGYEDQAWAFFDTFEPLREYPRDFLLRSKARQLLTDLTEGDSLTRQTARLAMDFYTFDAEDLPFIYERLEKSGSLDSATWDLLVREFAFNQDERSASFLEALFEKEKDNTHRQTLLLQALSGLRTTEGMEAFFRLARSFRRDSFDYFVYGDLFEPLRDTPALARQFLPELIALQNNRALHYQVYNTLYSLLAVDSLDAAALSEFSSTLLADARRIVGEYDLLAPSDTALTFEEYWHFDALNLILGYLEPDPEVQDYLRQMQGLPDVYLLTSIAESLLEQSLEVQPAVWDTIFTEPHHWHTLLGQLEARDLFDHVPGRFLDQKKTVRAIAYSYFYDTYGELVDFEMIETRPYTLNEEEVTLYLFRFTLPEYEGAYMGVCSQPVAKEEISVFPELFDYSDRLYAPEVKEVIFEDLRVTW